MHTLSGEEILHIWEIGLHQHPIERALTMLNTAFPQVSSDELITLSIGQRDAYLLSVRERTFGSQFAGFAECQQCQEKLEFSFDASDVRVGMAPLELVGQEQQIVVEDYTLEVRLPNTTDLAVLGNCSDVTAARDLLLQRCVSRVLCDGDEASIGSLSDRVITALGEQLIDWDPQSEVQLGLSCPSCDYRWSVVFDIVLFLWKEICTYAKRLLREVHTLATAYGWRESDILAMSAPRRQYYLEIVS
jgi:hypothetical protein